MAENTCADAVIQTLIAHGLETIYCIPGIQNDAFFNALFDAGNAIRAVHTRHEQGAAYMALGAAMATGRPSAFCVVPGPGFLNTTGALSTAYACSGQIFCLAGQISRAELGRGTGGVHEIPDQLAIMKQFTKWAGRANTPDEGAMKTAIAFRELTSRRPLPVGLEIPTDVLATKGDFKAVSPLALEAPPTIDENALDQALTLLKAAENPLIFVGSGALGAGPEVKRLAEHLQAPVIAHRMGRGVLDTRHPLSLDYPSGHRLWKNCDVVLAIGSRFLTPRVAWGIDDKLKIIHIDVDAQQLSIGPTSVAIVGDAKLVLAALSDEIERTTKRRNDRGEATKEIKATVLKDMAHLEPQFSFLKAIRAALPEDGIFVDEITQLGYVARLSFPTYAPRTFLTPGYQGTLGWGFATALGVKDACRDKAVISLNGDGGFLFTQPELATAVQHRIGLVTIVFNDNAYGNVKRMQRELYGNRVIASDLVNPDFVRLGESFGVKSKRVRTPDELRLAIDQAIQADEPALIEVPCGPMPNPRPFMSLPKLRGPGAVA